MTERDFDKLIKNSVKLYGDSYDTPDNTEHQFSENFENKMKILIDGRNIHQNRFKRLYTFLASAAAILIIGAVGFLAFNMINTKNIMTDNINSTAASKASQTESKNSIQNDNTLDSSENIKNEPQNNTVNNAAKSIEPDKSANTGENIAPRETDTVQADEPAQTKYNSEAASYIYTISGTYKGHSISLSGEETDKLVNSVLPAVSDSDTRLQLLFLPEDIENYRKNGFYLTISQADGQPVIIDEASGLKYDGITLMIDDTKGYAIGLNGRSESVYKLNQYDTLVQQLLSLSGLQ